MYKIKDKFYIPNKISNDVSRTLKTIDLPSTNLNNLPDKLDIISKNKI